MDESLVLDESLVFGQEFFDKSLGLDLLSNEEIELESMGVAMELVMEILDRTEETVMTTNIVAELIMDFVGMAETKAKMYNWRDIKQVLIQLEREEKNLLETTIELLDLTERNYRIERANLRRYQWWSSRDVTMEVADMVTNPQTRKHRLDLARAKRIHWWGSRDVPMKVASEVLTNQKAPPSPPRPTHW